MSEVREFLSKAAQMRLAHATPEQLARRREVARRTAIVSSGVRRGPNAPKDGTFGGVAKS